MWNIVRLIKNEEVHDIKNKYQSDMLTVQHKARKQKEHGVEVLRMLRMMKMAEATGGRKRGL